MRAFIFPGQGAQKIGMGQALAETYPEARAVFEEVDDSLDQNLSALMWTGTQEELTLTENAQPALMATSIAALRALKAEGIGIDTAAYVAGHSLGEYSALAAVGALSLKDTAQLLKTRGQAMQQAVPLGQGAMAAILGLDFETAKQIAEEAAQDEVCQAANDNDPAQVVLSGDKLAVERAIEIAKEKGAKRALLLPVSAPFHCALMEPAAKIMAQALEKVDISSPPIPFVANVVADAVSDPAIIRSFLVEQVTGLVRWRESVMWMQAKGVNTYWEIGTGKTLCGMVRRIDRNATCLSISDPDSIKSAQETFT